MTRGQRQTRERKASQQHTSPTGHLTRSRVACATMTSPPARNLSLRELQSAVLDMDQHGHQQTGRNAVWDPHRRGAGVLTGSLLVRVHAGHAGAGASTLALALADAGADLAKDDPRGPTTRLIDGASPQWSGLANATSRDLPECDGWRSGLREGNLAVERLQAEPAGVHDVPRPLQHGHLNHRTVPGLVVLDLGWSTRELLTAPRSWMWTLEPDIDLVVTRATHAGRSQTEHLLAHLNLDRTVVAVVGGRRHLRAEQHGDGPRLRRLRDAGAVVMTPLLGKRAPHDITPTPTPPPLRWAGRKLLHVMDGRAQDHSDAAPSHPLSRDPGDTLSHLPFEPLRADSVSAAIPTVKESPR